MTDVLSLLLLIAVFSLATVPMGAAAEPLTTAQEVL